MLKFEDLRVGMTVRRAPGWRGGRWGDSLYTIAWMSNDDTPEFITVKFEEESNGLRWLSGRWELAKKNYGNKPDWM